MDKGLLADQEAPKEALKVLTGMVRRYSKALLVVEKKADALAKAQAAADDIIEREIPEYMAEIDIGELRLADGTPVSCETKTFGNITEKKRDKAHAWLRKNGHGDLIKSVVTATFGKGQEKEAKELETHVEDEGFTVNMKVAVNHNTLQAWVREMTEAGKKVPPVLFGVYQAQVVKIGKPKKTKGSR